MSRGIAQVEFEAEVAYLLANWKRSALAGFSGGVTVPDPGHGLDEISPVTVVGIPFDADNPDDVTPFTPEQLRTRDEAGATIEGTGFLAVELKPGGAPIVVSPGRTPEMREDHVLDILIVTPGRRGPDLAHVYAGALAMLFRRVHLDPAESGIDTIRNLSPPSERPEPQGDDGDWRYDRMLIRFARFYRAPAAGGTP